MPISIRGKSASKRPSKCFGTQSGLTLIEILVAMAIIGLIVGVSVTALRSVFSVNMKRTAGQLAATLRYLSNKAVTDHRYIRVIYDLQAQSYRIEECTEPILVSIEDEEKEAIDAEKQAEEGGDLVAEGEEGEGKEGEAKSTKTSSCVPSDSRLLKPVKLPSGVLFKDVVVSYLSGKREAGKAYTYFFPDGYATPTVVNFKDEDDEDHYSVELEALSGKVKVASEYRESLTEGSREE